MPIDEVGAGMRTQSFKLSLNLIGILVTMLSACVNIEDQRLIRPEDSPIANPAPVLQGSLDEQNRPHQVLVAVIDSGVDYTHPALSRSMHYSREADGKLRLGYDFVAQDLLPSPFVIRTSTYPLPAAPKDEPWSADRSNLEDVHSDGIVKERLTQEILKRKPELAEFLNPRRSWLSEKIAGIEHGTHVAGLVAYSRPFVGILPYRVLPYNRPDKAKKEDSEETLHQSLLGALERAIADGAQIINLSIEQKIGKPLLSPFEDEEKAQADFERELEAKYSKKTPWIQKEEARAKAKEKKKEKEPEKKETAREKEIKKFASFIKRYENTRALIEAHPNVLFVAAAGNGGDWIDGKVKYGSPCGIRAKNLICVGALDHEGEVANFTSLPLYEDRNLVFALGEKVLSSVPYSYCDSPSMTAMYLRPPRYFKGPGFWTRLFHPSSRRTSQEAGVDLDKIYELCKRNQGYRRLDGTSMAAPLVSGIAADIIREKGSMPAEALIREIISMARKDRLGEITIYKLDVKSPPRNAAAWEPKIEAL